MVGSSTDTSDLKLTEKRADIPQRDQEEPTVRASRFPVIGSNQDLTQRVPSIGRPALISLAPAGGAQDAGLHVRRYEQLELIGVGGEGSVYSAVDRSFCRQIAIKVMHTDTLDDARRREAFIREARITASLEHPNILPIYDIDADDAGRAYFTMRKAQGETLSALLSRAIDNPDEPPEPISTWDKIVRLVDKVCDAVAYAHSVGYVHQDIKPGNIILGAFGNVLLADWGTAVQRDERGRAGLQIVGTPKYMAPEQARAEAVDERTDIYCLGATLFHLLTRRPPISDPDPALLWNKKRHGHVDDVPCPPDVPEELLSIVRKAMAPLPEDRFQSVPELQHALGEVQRHEQSLKLSTSVAARLAATEPLHDYGEVTTLRARAQSALELWPESPHARRLISEATARHVELALDTGDLSLAERLLAGDVANRGILEQRLEAARGIRRRQRVRARWAAAASVLALGLLVSLAVFLVRDHYLSQANWHVLANYDLTRRDQVAHLARSHERLDESSPVPPEDITKEGLVLNPGDTYWFADAPNRGDFRFEAKAKWTTGVDGIEVFADTRREQPPMYWHAPSGLSCQFGGWAGTLTYFSIQEKAGAPDTSRGVRHDFEAGRWYSLVFERRESRIRLSVDGRVVFEDFLFVPFEGKDHKWFGIRAWNRPVVLNHVTIERLSIPEKASPVVAGDSVFRLGMYREALEQYETVAEDHSGTAVEQVALAKAYLAAERLKDRKRRLELLSKLERKYPNSPYLARCVEEEALASWREGRYDGAVRRMRQAFAKNPDSRVAAQILATHGRAGWPRSAITKLMPWIGRTTDVQRLDLSHLGLGSIDFLKQKRIDDLVLTDNRIRDLSPLRHVALSTLRISDNPVSDLSPLRGKALNRLEMHRTNVTDLSPLAGSGLSALDVSGSPVRDLSVLRSLPLKEVALAGIGLSDLEPLRGLELNRLDVDHNSIEGLEPVRGMPLETLHAEANLIRSLDPLASAPLVELKASNNPIKDIQAVTTMKRLVRLELGGCKIHDLSPLAGRHFERLTLPSNDIDDVSALSSVRADWLDLNHNRIVDASPLANGHWQTLDLFANPLRSLSAFADHPPRTFWFSSAQLDGTRAANLIAKWSATATTRDLAYVLEIQRAWLVRDLPRLMALRRRAGNEWYLPIYVEQTLAEARATAELLGAHLFWLRDARHGDRLRAAIPLYQGGFWNDVRIGDHELVAPDGALVNQTDLFVQTRVWDYQGSEGTGYSYAPGFGAVIARWPLQLSTDRHVYLPLLEWDDEPANSPSP